MTQLTTGALLSNYEEALKLFYLDPVKDQLNNDNVLNSILNARANEVDVAGNTAKIDVHYGRTTGTGSRRDGDDLPTAGRQLYKQVTVPMKYDYGRVQFTGPTIAATRNDRGAFVRVVDSEMTGLITDLQRENNRKMWGCGYGVLARWRTTGSGTSYTLQRKYRANTAGGDGFGSTFGGKYLEENGSAVPVVLGTSSSAIVSATVDTTNIVVTAVADASDGTYTTITCTDPSVTEAAGTFYVRPATMVTYDASNNTGGARLEIMGLRGIVTDEDIDEIALTDGGTNTSPHVDPLQSIDADSYSWWRASVDKHSSGRYAGQRALTLPLMQKMFDKVEIKAGKDVGPDLILTTHAIRSEYLSIMNGMRREVNTMQLDGGFTAIDYNGVPFTVDRDAIDGEIYFITTSDIQLYRMSDWEWMDMDGSIFSRVADKDAYEATMFRYAELGCNRRNSQGVLCDISYTAL